MEVSGQIYRLVHVPHWRVPGTHGIERCVGLSEGYKKKR